MLIYRFIPMPMAVQVDMILPCVVMFFGMAWFLRRYVKDAGAWSGALFVTFSAKWLAHLEHLPMLVTLAHLPWLLGAMQIAITTPSVRRRHLAGVALAFLTGSQFLFGHPQTLWFSVLSQCAFAVCLLFHRPQSWKAWATVAFGTLLGVCMGAVKVLGTLSFFAESSRGAADPGFANQFAMNPHALLGAFAPYLICKGVTGWGGIYFGAVPLTLAAWWLFAGMWRPARLSDPSEGENHRAIRQLSLFAAILIVITVWLSPGLDWKLYYLQTLLPVVGKLRCPERFHMLTTFYLVVLGSLAFSRLIRNADDGHKLSWKSILVPWLLVAVAIVIAAYFFFGGRVAPERPVLGYLFFGPLMFGLAAAAFTIAARGHRVGLLLLIIIGAVDLGLYGLGNPFVKKIWWKTPKYEEFLAGAFEPPDPNAGRLYDTSAFANVHWLHGCRLASGYMGGMTPQRQLDYRHINTLRAAEVAWFYDFWRSGTCPA